MNDNKLIHGVYGPAGTVVCIMLSICLKISRLVHVGSVGDKVALGQFFCYPEYYVRSPFSVSIDQLLIHNHRSFFLFLVALQPNAGHGLLILEVSRSHTATHHSR